MLAFRIRELPGLLPLHLVILPRTIGLMLIGVAAWPAGLFDPGSRTRRWLPIAAIVGILGGAALAVGHANGLLSFGERGEISLDRLGTTLLACGYGAALVWVWDQTSAHTLLAWAAPIGRMAFTNYLMQSIIFGWIFYGYGFRMFGKLGVAAALAIGTVVYVAQVVFSAYWLQSYRYGLVAWLWRSVMYGKRQPFRRR